ncbi:carbohydrate ABC transporter permease [Salinibacterium sp. SWN1162]|uniref:carbohydrate ABC transporter permease n=1 Tax=Salinibacterium sp. SWN1162 TaxID=2792053 RepID=UPI0018CE9FC8|nr:carbohydrate ABC transporter permease [Salinibacterium sp. SWN1162]MBH0009951.1 carbohydrate ABC transporter permease [Salinibacterium sp. SWN1162]
MTSALRTPLRRRPVHFRRRASNMAIITLSAVVGLAFALPLIWTITNSFRPGAEIFKYIDPIQWFTFVPESPILSNYVELFSGTFGRAVLNSIGVSAVTVVLGVLICAACAFALAAIPFKGSGAVFAIVVLSFLVPFDAIAIPLANLFRDWGLANTFTGLILPGLGNGLAIFLIRQFFLAVPTELVEAGRLDGLGWWGIFSRIYLPLSAPALFGAGLTLFLFQWQSYVWPLLIGTDQDHILGPVALANLKGQFSIDYGVLFAGAVILTIIPLIIIVSMQRYFIQSVSTTGIK